MMPVLTVSSMLLEKKVLTTMKSIWLASGEYLTTMKFIQPVHCYSENFMKHHGAVKIFG